MTICVLGSINRDVVLRVATLPGPGETVAARETLMLAGGKGANQAVAAARLGAPVRMIGAVGADADGRALLAGLTADAVDAGEVRVRPDVMTGAAYIALDDAGENQILVAAGANATITAAEAAALRAGDRVALAQLEVPAEAVRAFLTAAARIGARSILNTAPATAQGAALLPLADILVLNESEAARYLGVAVEAIGAGSAAAIRRLLAREGQAAIVTLGAAGALLVEAGGERLLPARAVRVVDTTGAGDCFCGALAASLAQGAPLAHAAARAVIAASLCVGRIGAAPAMPHRAELDAIAPSE